ncbi:Protein kinase-like domain protein [Niveomyces insectorum RCEF 264]|uniref:Protein kinase-like domain protein n=1 Tax=Niveomyces insectorum RCEF 264 TaxID=1081102 RepID=A0A167MZS3_9HYPO|nr:Protein kinase-like domain protein [Niveomyces insectorum RCEF 264]
MSKAPSTTWFGISYDRMIYDEGSNVYDAWAARLLQPEGQATLEAFVARRFKHRGEATYMGSEQGSYNIVFRFRFADGQKPDIALLVAKPGHTAVGLADEKIENAVNWMRYLRTHTTIPIPEVHVWGSTADSPEGVGSAFIFMDYVEGISLRTYMRRFREWTKANTSSSNGGSSEAEDAALNKKRRCVYEQVAAIHQQLYRCRFDRIGSITHDTASGQWAVTRRPLTMDMHQQVLGVPCYSTAHWPRGPFRRTRDYLDFVLVEQQIQLHGLRNLNVPPDQAIPDASIQASQSTRRRRNDVDLDWARDIAAYRFRARQGVARLRARFYPSHGDDGDDGHGRFVAFNPDMDPRNMIVDPDTGRIVAVLDFEYMNAMPAEFACNAPVWLKGVPLTAVLERGFFRWFVKEYEPLMEQFLVAMRCVEDRAYGAGRKRGEEEEKETASAAVGRLTDTTAETRLSDAMRTSWQTQRFWFDYAVNSIDDVDAIYWAVFHDEDAPRELPPELEQAMEQYRTFTEEQIAHYEASQIEYDRTKDETLSRGEETKTAQDSTDATVP